MVDLSTASWINELYTLIQTVKRKKKSDAKEKSKIKWKTLLRFLFFCCSRLVLILISSPAVIFVVVCRLDPEILGWTNQLTTFNSIKTVALCACFFFFSFLSMPFFFNIVWFKDLLKSSMQHELINVPLFCSGAGAKISGEYKTFQ